MGAFLMGGRLPLTGEPGPSSPGHTLVSLALCKRKSVGGGEGLRWLLVGGWGGSGSGAQQGLGDTLHSQAKPYVSAVL